MENTILVVDGQTLVDNIHSIKQWVYIGLIRIYVPLASVEAVEQLYKKSLEPKEIPKDDRQQKRQSGRPRKEYPLFDINPRTAKEFLDRAKSEVGVEGISFQQDSGEEFTQWQEENEQAVNVEPIAPPSSFSEALLRKLNIAKPEDRSESGNAKPKLVAKSALSKTSPYKHHKIPVIKRQDIPDKSRSFVSAALWKAHESENNPLQPESYAVLVQGPEMERLARKAELPVVQVPALRSAIKEKMLRDDIREAQGMLEGEFPDVPRRVLPPRKPLPQPVKQTNGHLHTYEEIAERLEATAVLAVQELIGGLVLDNAEANLQESLPIQQSPKAELRPSVSYAMAAGAKAQAAVKSLSPTISATELQAAAPKDPIPEPAPITVLQKESPPDRTDPVDEDPSSDEEVVLFVGKKRRSQDASRGISRPVSRPVTAAGPEKIASPKQAKAILESTLKPQSPVFTPGQLYTPSSPIVQPIPEAYPTPISKNNSPTRRASPPKRDSATPPNARPKGSNMLRAARAINGHTRGFTSEDAQRQSELILQRQREAIKRSAQLQQAQAAARAEEDAKMPKREIEMSPTANPVVIDPDEFGRDYTIRANAPEDGRGRGKGSMRRGGRGRGTRSQVQQTPPTGEKKEIDFVLKTGAPRGSARGRGKLWVP